MYRQQSRHCQVKQVAQCPIAHWWQVSSQGLGVLVSLRFLPGNPTTLLSDGDRADVDVVINAVSSGKSRACA